MVVTMRIGKLLVTHTSSYLFVNKPWMHFFYLRGSKISSSDKMDLFELGGTQVGAGVC